MLKRKIANAQKRYERAQATTEQCKQNLLAGGSYAVWKMAVAEEYAALEKLNALREKEQV